MDWVKEKLDEFNKNKKAMDEKKRIDYEEMRKRDKIVRDKVQIFVKQVMLPTLREFAQQLNSEGYKCQVTPINVTLFNENETIVDEISLELSMVTGVPPFYMKYSHLSGLSMISYNCYSMRNIKPEYKTIEYNKLDKEELENHLKIFFENVLKENNL
jgi:hypothetical protein